MSTECLYLCPDALMRCIGQHWLLSNPRSRHHVELDRTAAGVVLKCGAEVETPTMDALLVDSKGWDRTGFSSATGLTNDPSGLIDRVGPAQTGVDLRRLLAQRLMFIANITQYEAFLAPLDSVLDRSHLGTFHQRVGQHVLLSRRERDKWRWWQAQKFMENGEAIRPGPYKFVQESFFDSYFSDTGVRGLRILDFGCGNGYYSAKFAALGAVVTGIDTSAELIGAARLRYCNAATFISEPDSAAVLIELAARPSESFDIVYMSDTFLLLNPDPCNLNPVLPLIAEFRRLLSPGGRVTMIEPNATFWLAARLGAAHRPYAAVTEYRHPIYNVAPSLDRVVAVFGRAGFGLHEYLHPSLSSDAPRDLDLSFAEEFPIWDFLSFRRISEK